MYSLAILVFLFAKLSINELDLDTQIGDKRCKSVLYVLNLTFHWAMICKPFSCLALLFFAFFGIFGLASFDTVTTLLLSCLASFLPFSEVIPEIFRILWVPERSGNLCRPNARLPFSLQTFVRPAERKRFVSPIKTEKNMKPEYKPFVDALIELAIREDIGDGDHTRLLHPRDGKRPHALALQTGGYSRGHRNRTTGASTPGPPTCNSNRSSATATA